MPLWLKSSEGGDATAETTAASNDDEYVNRFIEPATADVRNEAVIGGYNRSISNLEMSSPCEFTAQSLQSATMGVSNRVDKIKTIEEIDRGIADGGSNQHDSDFGE